MQITWACKVGIKQQIGGKKILFKFAGQKNLPSIITLWRKASLTGHGLPFTGIILSLRFYVLWDKLNLALWGVKKLCVHLRRGDRYNNAYYMLDFWSLHHLDSKAAYCRALQALDTIIGLFVQTYQSQMGMISRIDPSLSPNIFRKPLIILAGVFWEAVTEKCHVDSLQFTVEKCRAIRQKYCDSLNTWSSRWHCACTWILNRSK